MNRFFRSAFFPLIVIVLLVWLASQTLIPKHSNARPNVTYSTLRVDVQQHPEDIKSVEFTPSKRQIGVNWQFTTADARIKLRKLYPVIQT